MIKSVFAGSLRERAAALFGLVAQYLGPPRHICAFFNSHDEEYRVLLPFIKDGLEAGEKVVHTVDPQRRDEHLQRLAAAGIEVTVIRQRGQLELRTWTDTHLRNGRFDQHKTLALFEAVVKDSKEQGFPLIRFVTHMEWALEKIDRESMTCWSTKRGQTVYGFAKTGPSTQSYVLTI